MNALLLYHGLNERGVRLESDGEFLKVNAPVGSLTQEDRTALLEAKPILLKFLAERQEPRGDERRFDVRPSRHPGYTSLYDPVHDEWHDFPTKDCFPSLVEEAYGRRNGGAA